MNFVMYKLWRRNFVIMNFVTYKLWTFLLTNFVTYKLWKYKLCYWALHSFPGCHYLFKQYGQPPSPILPGLFVCGNLRTPAWARSRSAPASVACIAWNWIPSRGWRSGIHQSKAQAHTAVPDCRRRWTTRNIFYNWSEESENYAENEEKCSY